MPYRPRIPDDIHERVEKNTAGERINDNRVYIGSIKFMYDESGEYSEWLKRVNKFAKRNEISTDEAISILLCSVLDESGHINKTFRKPRLFSNELW